MAQNPDISAHCRKYCTTISPVCACQVGALRCEIILLPNFARPSRGSSCLCAVAATSVILSRMCAKLSVSSSWVSCGGRMCPMGLLLLVVASLWSAGLAAQPALFFKVTNQDTYSTLTEYSNPQPGQPQDSLYIVRSTEKPLPDLTLKAWLAPAEKATWEIHQVQIKPDGQGFTLKKVYALADQEVLTWATPEAGAYRVLCTPASKPTDPPLERTLWAMHDTVKLLEINLRDGCLARDLSLRFNTDRSTITNDLFRYYDLSPEAKRYITFPGDKYFQEVEWTDLQGRRLVEYSAMRLSLDEAHGNLPTEPQGYKVNITTSFGYKLHAETKELPPIAVLAKPDVKYNANTHADAPQWQQVQKESPIEAPLQLQLAHSSQNSTQVRWFILNDPRAAKKTKLDTLYQQIDHSAVGSTILSPDQELFSAGRYAIWLQASNVNTGCQDTALVVAKVDSSLINEQAIPNVFSPNGDGINDLFAFINPQTNLRSIKEFRLLILNRQGQLIYTYEGDPKRWEGWQGQSKHKGGMCPPGVYFYIIEAKGWDGHEFKNDIYKGALHLFK